MTGEGPIEDDRLQAQYDGIPVPCYTWRRDGGDFVLERANRAAVELTGAAIPGADRQARRASSIADRPHIVEDLERCTSRAHARCGARWSTRWPRTGQRRRLDVSYVFVPPDRVMVHADDVTELRESEERLRAVIATLESGVLTVDLEGQVHDANPAALQILGVTREQLASHPRLVARAVAALRGRPRR